MVCFKKEAALIGKDRRLNNNDSIQLGWSNLKAHVVLLKRCHNATIIKRLGCTLRHHRSEHILESEDTMQIPARFQPALTLLAAQLAERRQRAWIVGGTVRDALNQREIHDVDVVLSAASLRTARELADQLNAAYVELDSAREIARVVLDPEHYLDLALLRGDDIAADLAARDFTVNALAVPLEHNGQLGALLDPLDGAADIAQGQLRACAPTSIAADPLRMLRALRIAASYGWNITSALDAQIRQHATQIASVAAERCSEELLKILNTSWSAPTLRYLERSGVLLTLIPELRPTLGHSQPNIHFLDVWEHLLESVCAGEWMLHQLSGARAAPPPQLPSDGDDQYPPAFFNQPVAVRLHPELALALEWRERVRAHMQQPVGTLARPGLWKLALLLHDIAKPSTRADWDNGRVSFYGHEDIGAAQALSIAGRLRLSRQASGYIERVIAGHMRPGQLNSQASTSTRAAYRFFNDLGDAAVDTLLHSLADHLAVRGPSVNLHGWAQHLAWTDAMLGFHWDQQTEAKKRPLVDGRTLITALGIEPGPLVGKLLAAVREAQAIGRISTQEEALALARRLQADL